MPAEMTEWHEEDRGCLKARSQGRWIQRAVWQRVVRAPRCVKQPTTLWNVSRSTLLINWLFTALISRGRQRMIWRPAGTSCYNQATTHNVILCQKDGNHLGMVTPQPSCSYELRILGQHRIIPFSGLVSGIPVGYRCNGGGPWSRPHRWS